MSNAFVNHIADVVSKVRGHSCAHVFQRHFNSKLSLKLEAVCSVAIRSSGVQEHAVVQVSL